MRKRILLPLCICSACAVTVVLLLAWLNPKVTAEDFSFYVDQAQTTITAGETVTYTAKFTNLSGRKLRLAHCYPLIAMYVYPEGECPETALGMSKIYTTVAAGETIEKAINVELPISGTYILEASIYFSVGENEFSIKEDPIKLTVING